MEIFNESERQRDKFRKSANKLLNQCFLVKRKADDKEDYIFVLQHKTYFEEYFELLGYDIEIKESQGVIGLKNIFGRGKLRLKKIETIILLILRKIYIEKNNEIRANEDVVFVIDELLEKYSYLNSKIKLDKTTLREVFRMLKKYNLVKTIDTDITRSDAKVIIYPSILLSITNENINEINIMIEKDLSNLMSGGVINEETYEN